MSGTKRLAPPRTPLMDKHIKRSIYVFNQMRSKDHRGLLLAVWEEACQFCDGLRTQHIRNDHCLDIDNKIVTPLDGFGVSIWHTIDA